VFVAELSDKTQLAKMLFAAQKEVSKIGVFAGAALALVIASGERVVAGGMLSQFISARQLQYIARSDFITVGIWTLIRAWPGGRAVRRITAMPVSSAAATTPVTRPR
jgi:putative Ca2+/H+ antiporter (TMEM165/GDT1 family)